MAFSPTKAIESVTSIQEMAKLENIEQAGSPTSIVIGMLCSR